MDTKEANGAKAQRCRSTTRECRKGAAACAICVALSGDWMTLVSPAVPVSAAASVPLSLVPAVTPTAAVPATAAVSAASAAAPGVPVAGP